MEKLHLKGIYIYPIKSLSGISLSNSFAGERGLEHDRRWMLIDSENTFITQRTYPVLSLTDLRIENGFIVINHKNDHLGEEKIPLKTHEGQSVTAKVWDDSVQLLWPKLPADEWFSELLQTAVRLVYMPEDSSRQVDREYVNKRINTNLSDGYPYLLINQRSVEDVSEKSGIVIETSRFRPNLTIETVQPFEEDNIKKILIGNLPFRNVKACARCLITTIDPNTGIAGKEPLKTLSTYRKNGNKILFGLNMIAERYGSIHVGDEIKLIQ
jgi:uncharacterized protein